MILELVFLALLVLGLCVLVYRGAVHEFQILQKEYEPDTDWSEVLSEQLPLVIRGLPRSWVGGWNRAITSKRTWQVLVRSPEGKRLRTTWANYLQTPSPRPLPENGAQLSEAAKLSYTFSNWGVEGLRRWSWLPVGSPEPFLLSKGQCVGVKKAVAEFSAIVATDGVPLDVWIAHEGAIPSHVADELVGKDPWVQTVEEIAWIGDVKFIEVRLRPGNALLLPRHWWYALRPSVDSPQEDNDAWFWVGQFHTPISYVAGKLRKD
jgi:hypothetical protein